MTDEEIEKAGKRFRGCNVHLHSYSEFASLLRLRIVGDNQDSWYLSFDFCEYIQGPIAWQLGTLRVNRCSDGRLRIEDIDSGFNLVCKSAGLIHEDEYCENLDSASE